MKTRDHARLDRIEQVLGLPPLEWPPVDPPPPQHRVLAGATVDTIAPGWQANWAALAAAVGQPLNAARHFDPTAGVDIPTGPARNSIGTGRTIFLSTKQAIADARAGYYGTGLGVVEPIFHTVWHEVEDNLGADVTYDQWRNANLLQLGEAKNKGDSTSLIFMLWSMDPASGRTPLMELIAGDQELMSVVDAVGWDVYQRNDTPYTQATFRPWSFNGDLITQARSLFAGKQTFLGEVGCPERFNPDGTPTAYKSTWMIDMIMQARAEEWLAILWYNYWKPAYAGSKHASTDDTFLLNGPRSNPACAALFADLAYTG